MFFKYLHYFVIGTYQETICGNKGVNTRYVKANQNVANNIPTTAPHRTCQTVWYSKYILLILTKSAINNDEEIIKNLDKFSIIVLLFMWCNLKRVNMIEC